MGNPVSEIYPGIFHLQFEIPYNVQPVNIHLLDAEPVTLIDTGPIMEGTEEAIPARLEELGFPPSRIGRIILTHHHPDHMGMAARLKAAGGAEIICHRLGAPLVSDYLVESKKLVSYLVGLSNYMGLDQKLVRASINKTSQWYEVAESVSVDREVEDGDIIKGKPFSLQAVYTPGHCIDHICLYLEQHKCMFTGDMLLYSITPNPDMYPPWLSSERSGLPGYLRSLEKIQEIEVDKAMPGHGKLIDDFKGRIGEVLTHHHQRIEYIVETLSRREMTALDLALELIRFIKADLTVENVFLAIREVFGHLVILKGQRRVTEELKDETAYFSVNQ